MKKLVLVILTRFGSLTHWKWLTLWAGAVLLCFMQSCKTKIQENSPDIMPNDTANAEINMCYFRVIDIEPNIEPDIEVIDSNMSEKK